jgi:membrane protease YdiL (CAAX protease family)
MSEQVPPLNNVEAGEPAPPPAPSEREPFWGWGDVLLFLGLSIPSFLAGWASVNVALAFFHVQVKARALQVLPQQFAGYLLLFIILKAILRVQYNRPFWRSLGWTEIRMPVLRIVILGVLAAFGVALLGTLMRTPTTDNPMTELMKDRLSLLLMAIFGITAGPLCEELIFRGFLQPLLVRSFGAVIGVVGAALPFGLLHFQQYGNSWRHALIVAAAGAGFGWMRHVTGSTKASTIMHASYNALFFWAVLLERGRV